MFFMCINLTLKEYFAWRNFANIDKIIVALHKKIINNRTVAGYTMIDRVFCPLFQNVKDGHRNL